MNQNNNNNKMFTEEEIRAIFSALDVDGSKSIDMDEFYTGFKQLFPSFSQQTIFSLFRMQDKDNNGTLDVDEFISLIRFIEKKAYSDDPFVILFDRCDLDGNGKLDAYEFKLIWKCLVPDIDEAGVNALFIAADEDDNGFVEFDEYMELIALIKKKLGVH